jgi:uncharacterized protein YjbJ (UPF0337 family)
VTTLPGAPGGETTISTRALKRVVSAAAAAALGVQPGQVSVGLHDTSGGPELTVRVPAKHLPPEWAAAQDADAGVNGTAGNTATTRAEHEIRAMVAELTGAPVAEVSVQITTPRLRLPSRQADHPEPPPRERENTMSASDKIKNAAEDLKGKAKEAAGKATNDDSKVADGKADQASANVKKAGENVKDVFKE